MRHVGPGFGLGIAALAFLGVGAPEVEACGWLWECADRPHAYREAPRGYGYRSPRRAYRYGRRGWAYGYTSPARAYGDPYAAWSSTSIPPTRWYLGSALPGANTDAVGLRAPVASAQGLMRGGLPARGPSLFGPGPDYYYGAPAYGYRAPSYYAPPDDTASWWLEPRRRR